jgi:hypothetical protein
MSLGIGHTPCVQPLTNKKRDETHFFMLKL